MRPGGLRSNTMRRIPRIAWSPTSSSGDGTRRCERVRELEQQIEQQTQQAPSAAIPTPEEFAELAAELEAVWQHPDADARLKKRIVRTLIREVVVDVDAAAGEVILVIHWKGGVHTELRLPRRRRGQNSQHTSPEIVAAVRVLARICTDSVIAGVLNRNGLRTGTGQSLDTGTRHRAAEPSWHPLLRSRPASLGGLDESDRGSHGPQASALGLYGWRSSVASSPRNILCQMAPGYSGATP